MITIVDYGLGNQGSICNMLKKIGAKTEVASTREEILNSEKLILPGVGSFDTGMHYIKEKNLLNPLQEKVLGEKTPILGICLGMQLLTEFSEEGNVSGLGWVSAKTSRFPTKSGLKVPHMGWNLVTPTQESILTNNLPEETRFYFVHSYCVHVDNSEDSILKGNYGISFDAAIQHENIYGAQFHPEKSHKFGMQFLKNFASL
jgi:imidazole glycerol-phosphate synthase subunit HisH